MDFGTRLTPHKLFESYTPTELALKRMTLDNPDWVHGISTIIAQNTWKPLAAQELEVYFREFINLRFPLPRPDVNEFENYVLKQEERKARVRIYTEDWRLWNASHPAGQKGFQYPQKDYRGDHDTFDLLTYR